MSVSGPYVGGATRIYLSVDGTIWPDDTKDPRPKSAGRWDNDTVGILGPDDVKPINIVKVAKHRYIAGLAHLYRSGKPINELPLPPRELWPSIRQYGNSIISWVNQDEKILKLFWACVKKQNEAARNPEKKPLLISTKKKKKGGASAGARRAYLSGGRLLTFTWWSSVH